MNRELARPMSMKIAAPTHRETVEREKLYRCNLPFDASFDNLIYIGSAARQTWRVAPHFHDHFEFCYIVEGSGWFSIDDTLYRVEAGDLFITKPGELHNGGASGDKPFKLYYFGFNLDRMRELERDYYALGPQRVTSDMNGAIRQLFEQMLGEIQQGHNYACQAAHGYFMLLLAQTLRIYSQSPFRQHSRGSALSPEIKHLLDFLHANVRAQHRGESLAAMVHLSRTHLDYTFKQQMGIPLGNYIRSLCLERARYLLTETTLSVTTIADKLQFSSIHHFSMFFKRHHGMSPLEYRSTINSPLTE